MISNLEFFTIIIILCTRYLWPNSTKEIQFGSVRKTFVNSIIIVLNVHWINHLESHHFSKELLYFNRILEEVRKQVKMI